MNFVNFIEPYTKDNCERYRCLSVRWGDYSRMSLQAPTRPKSFLNTRQMGIKNRKGKEKRKEKERYEILICILKSSCANLELHFVRKSSFGLQGAISVMQLLLIITALLPPAKGKGQWASIRRVASPIVYSSPTLYAPLCAPLYGYQESLRSILKAYVREGWDGTRSELRISHKAG